MSSTGRRLSLLFILLFLAHAVSFGAGPSGDVKVNISGKVYVVHQVTKGETLYSLARTYSTTVDAIIEHNQVLNDGGLKSGQMIKIPLQAENQVTRRSKKEFSSYVVQQGETLYSISRRFSLSIDTLLDDNPSVDPTHLSVGTRLFIRKSGVGQTSDSEAMSQLRAQGQILSSVETACVEYHVVEKGETAASIASQHSVDERQILDLNGNDSSRITEGAIIRLPVADDRTGESVAEHRDGKVKVLEAGDTASVSLLLPFTRDGQASSSIMDFYRGFLMGLDRCRDNGLKVNLHVFDSCRDTVHVREMLDRDAFAGTNLIVGPVYEECVEKILPYAERNGIPVVSPLAAIQKLHSPILFQMAPDAGTKYAKLKELFSPERRVVFIRTKSNDAAFMAEMKTLAGSHPIEHREYEFENPNLIEKRERMRAMGAQVAESKGDLTPLLHTDGQMTIVIVSDNETDVDRVISAVTSARISLLDRSMNVADVTIIGSNRWMKYSNIDRAIFFRGNVTLSTSYIANGTSIAEKKFNRMYLTHFGSVPTPFSCRGYDAAVIFVSSLFGPIGDGLKATRYIPIEVPYEFSRGEDGVVRNREWVRVNYNSDYSLIVE